MFVILPRRWSAVVGKHHICRNMVYLLFVGQNTRPEA